MAALERIDARLIAQGVDVMLLDAPPPKTAYSQVEAARVNVELDRRWKQALDALYITIHEQQTDHGKEQHGTPSDCGKADEN